MANLSYRSLASGVDNTFTVATDTADVPSGTVQNDLGVIFYSSGDFADPAPTHTQPSGWSTAGTGTYIGGSVYSRITVYYRIEPATPVAATLTSSGAAGHGWFRMTFDNPNTTPFDVISAFAEIASGTTAYTNASVTQLEANEMLVKWCAQNAGSITFTEPTGGWTEPAGGDANSAEVSYLLNAASGATGTKTATASSSTATGMTVMVAFRSEAAGTADGALSSSGAGTLTAASESVASGAMSSTGVGSLTTEGAAIATGALSADGVSTFIATGQSLTVEAGAWSSAGTGEFTGEGAAVAGGDLTSTGEGTFSATSESIAGGDLTSTGAGTFEATGASIAEAPLTAAGTGSAEFVGDALAEGAGAFSSTGVSTFTAEGAAIAAGDLEAAGEASADFVGFGGTSAPAPEPEPGPIGDGGAAGRWRGAQGRKRKRELEREDQEIIEAIKQLAPHLLQHRRTLH